jgi:hypothetical protein
MLHESEENDLYAPSSCDQRKARDEGVRINGRLPGEDGYPLH